MGKIEFKVLRQQVSYRGGGVEVDLTPLGYEGEKMTAYQNYLGGGMLGRIGNDCTIVHWEDDYKLRYFAKELQIYFHSLTNHADDEWESETLEENQRKPLSAY